MAWPMDHLDDCDAAGYALQLNLYKYILQRHYDVTVGGMVLSQVRNNSFYTYVPELELECEYLMASKRASFAPSPKADRELKAARDALLDGRHAWTELMPSKKGLTQRDYADGRCKARPPCKRPRVKPVFDM